MGQERPVMEDDGHASHTCKTPTLIGALEEEEKVKSSLGTNQVEASLRNYLDRRISRGKFLRDDDKERRVEQQGVLEEQIEEEGDAEDNNNNNCNGGGAGDSRGEDTLDFLSASWLASASSSDRAGPDARMQGGAEAVHGDNAAVCDVTRDSRRDQSGQPGHAGVQNKPRFAELTSSDFGGFEIFSLFDTKHEKCDTGVTSLRSDPTSSAKEHIYCDVYCIANERNHDTVTSEVISASGEGLVLHTAEDLVNPLRESSLSRRSSQQGGSDGATEARPCRVCLDRKTMAPLPCCRKLVCDECLTLYVTSQVQVGKVHIRCPISECNGMLENTVVVSHLAGEDALRYRYFLELSQLDASTKPCPRCRHFTSLGRSSPARVENKYKVQCGGCQFVWCFKCHAPWHQGIKCRDYRKGDKQLRSWACVIERGQRNAQKCPKCKIHIQRTEGCDHMVCTQCNTNFCYRCGDRYRQLRYFGDHTSNLSVFGCKYRYLPEKPHLRRCIRGSICGVKLLLAPLVLLLVLVVGGVALVIGVIAYPVYYVCKKRTKRRSLGSWRS